MREIVFIQPYIFVRRLRFARDVLLFVLLSASCAFSADIVFVHSPGAPTAAQKQLETATGFYGLNLKPMVAGSTKDDQEIAAAVEREDTVGVVISADALASVDKTALLQALRGRRGGSAPLLILGVGPDVNPSLLESWSGGAATGCKRMDSSNPSQYVFGRVDGITGQLADLEIPLPAKDAFYIVPSPGSTAQSITSLRRDGQLSPVFVETAAQQQKVFTVCANYPGENPGSGDDVVAAFLQVAPAMIFVQYCAGEQGWHALHQYANLTIDDPWLRQPYGYVDYDGLFGEMEKHNFHTTIAFIPWNYDRSEPEVVSLFRSHPERFSITVHGDNHDHKEFTDYRAKPLTVQIADMKQSLARMEKFQSLTGVPYDNVMVFPHSIAPENTLEALKSYNYLATINSTNVPQGSAKPSDVLFALRPVTLSFGDFPSISRYSIDVPVPKSYVAVSEFLGNPLLFYGHSDSFAKGVDSFDGVADQVNSLEPDVRWRGLGEIVRHQYLIRLRSDSNYDVLAFSGTVCLDNTSGRDSIFYVRKQESGSQVINSVDVDGQRYPYQLQDGYVNISVPVPNGKTRCAAIQYKNDLELASIGISHNSFIIYLLRKASDFRDIYLSKFSVGLTFIHFYNQREMTPAELFECALVLMLIFLFAAYCLRLYVRPKRHS